MISVIIRPAVRDDTKSLLEIPAYSKGNSILTFKDVLVAERDRKVVGAVSIGHKDITYVSGKWKNSDNLLDAETRKISGPWISKLFVFPEYRYHGIGTKLIEESIKYLRNKGATEAYAGIYIKNAFREVSREIFEDNGFEEIGSCICFLQEGHCQGTLLKKAIASTEAGKMAQVQIDHKHEELTNEIATLGLTTGADLVGFVSAEKLEKGAPKGHRPSDLMANAKSIIILVCGRKLNEDRDYFYRWGPDFSLAYIRLKDEVKQRRKEARQCMTAVKNFLINNNFKAVTEPHGWSGILSFKMAAYLAGLGVFGKGSFLIHPKLGPLNVLACILTDAPLQYGTSLTIDVCGDCVKCVKACKYGAFRKEDNNFKWIREKCRCYDLIMNPVTLKWTYGPCNSKCANTCPVGNSSNPNF